MTLNKFFKFSFVLLASLFLSCSSSRKMAKQFEELPNWVKQKPQNKLTYFGVGKAAKTGFPDRYIKAAERQALTDLAEHISVKVNTNSLLYQFDIDDKQSDFYMNKQKIESSKFLEGYTISKTYENEDYYWNLIEISKAKYEEIRQKRKTVSLEKSYQYFKSAHQKKEEKDLYDATSYFVKSLETLKPYWGDKTIFTKENGETIDLTIANIDAIHSLFKNLEIKKQTDVLKVARGDKLNSTIPVGILTHPNYGILEHFPYVINTSFTLEKSKQIFTKKEGAIHILPLEVGSKNQSESLMITIDGKEILKQLTSDLILRKILTNSVPKPIQTTYKIEVVQPLILVKLTSKSKSLDLEKTRLQTINFYEKKGIFTPTKKSNTAYSLFIEINPLGSHSYALETKFFNATQQQEYGTSRTIKIDPFVYNTNEKILKSIFNTLKRKELEKVLAIME